MPGGPLEGLSRRLADRLHELKAAGEGVKQGEIAERLGVSASAVSYWASGTTSPDLERIPEIAAAIGVRAGWLAFGEEPKEAGDLLGPGSEGSQLGGGPRRTTSTG